MTSGAPIMSSQKIGPSSLLSRTRSCTGAAESSDSMLPTTGLVGGCGIGLNLLLEAIADYFPNQNRRHCERSEAIQNLRAEGLDCFVASLLAMTPCYPPLTKPPSPPFDQLR